MLTPEQLVAAIKLDEAVKARPPSERQIKTSTNQTLLDPVREFQRAMSEERDRLNASREAPKPVASSGLALEPPALPKPKRVEKWQRWYNSALGDAAVVQDVYRDGDGRFTVRMSCGVANAEVMLLGRMWSFLGYVRPDRVEVGQQWRLKTCVGVVELIEPERVLLRDAKGDEWWTDEAYILRGTYLGIVDGKTYISMVNKAIEQVAIVTGQSVSSVRACVEDIRQRYGEPAQRGAAPAPPPDPAAEERRALEVTAKRLIDNPPAWAYPKAWMMAVLRQVECRLSAAMLAREFSPRFCFYEELRLYQERRSAGQTHDAAKAKLNVPELCDVYARGMDIRAKPLLVRPVGIGRVR